MIIRDKPDVIVIGSGPNGLAAAIELQQSGASVLVLECSDYIGGGLHTSALTLPGFLHDRCSAVHPLARLSPFFRKHNLEQYGLRWAVPRIAMAHPLTEERAARIAGTVEETAEDLEEDGEAYTRLMRPLVERADSLFEHVLSPLKFPAEPLLMARFGLHAIQPAQRLASRHFRGARAQALFAGNAAHACQPLDHWLTSAVGLLLMVSAHHGGWPSPIGGAGQIAAAMVAHLRALGGEVRTGVCVRDYNELPKSALKIFDTAPRHVASICGDRLPPRFRKRLMRYRHGPAAYKVDYALKSSIPWIDKDCRDASTVHLGGTLREISEAEAQAWNGLDVPRPFTLVSQPSCFDETRAPPGQHTAWVYCHVPNGSTFDHLENMEKQLERFAPGFVKQVLARRITRPLEFEALNPNYVGGDIVGGVQDVRQVFHRPVSALSPYQTPAADIFLCSASTPPGGGIHGMSGYHAAQSILGKLAKGANGR